VRVYRPDVVELAELKSSSRGRPTARALPRRRVAREGRRRARRLHRQPLGARRRARGAHRDALGLDPSEVELTRLAGSLHDLGKLAIPEEILRKPGALTESERLVLERHPQIGYRMLESLGVDPVAEWVLHHHERWDGTATRTACAGDEIPLGARIIFVADAYDAMTSDRVYRGAAHARRGARRARALRRHAVRPGLCADR
jgi:response regulator RpfG family c-di-GMP phosphodiesterase